jgi:glycogen debranching enzyme
VNALWALSAECLSKIADELGYTSDAEQFRREYARIKDLMNRKLWDEKTGFYWNRLWESDGGRFSYRKSPATFWVLTAGIPDKRQAERMVKEHLLNPREFWGEFVLPSISRDDPAFVEQYYWRGTIWAPMNYFVYGGLKRYGYDARRR